MRPPMRESDRLATSAFVPCAEEALLLDTPSFLPTAATMSEERAKYHGTRPRSISLGFVPDYGYYDAWHRFAPGWYGSPYYYPAPPYGPSRP